MSAGLDNLIMLDNDVQKKVMDAAKSRATDSKKTALTVGVLEFEAWMRMLDSQVYFTLKIFFFQESLS